MGSLYGSMDYFILRPEKAGFFDILGLLFRRRRNLGSYKFIETNGTPGVHDQPWILVLVTVMLNVLNKISKPLALAGSTIEYLLNFFSLNGGILGLFWRIMTCSVSIPRKDSATFRSISGHIDGRVDLYQDKSMINYFSLVDLESRLLDGSVDVVELTGMASKIVYENAAYVENVVDNHWKMNFVGFYNFWNIFRTDYTTQACVFTNKAVDADAIVVAFRGTEVFNAQDWATDIDLSWLNTLSKLGRIHVGFLKALGLQNEKDFRLGFPKNYNGDAAKPLAYYALRQTLRSLLQTHKNAKIIMTGHSLGGALAALFPALLSYHNENDILNSLWGVYTFGQPRVGDAVLATYMTTFVNMIFNRYVFRYDIVPRIPFDLPPIALFKHYGTCVYYKDWYKGQVMTDSPNPNYFDPKLQISMYMWAWADLLRAFFIGAKEGKEFREGYVSIMYRMFGLLIPGIASHSPRDYINGGRLAKIANKVMV